MNVVLPIVIIAVISSVLIIALLVIVIAGIHASERRKSLSGRGPRSWPETVTRRVLGVHSELPRKPAPSLTGSKTAAK